jgi:hypothetical protein
VLKLRREHRTALISSHDSTKRAEDREHVGSVEIDRCNLFDLAWFLVLMLASPKATRPKML